MLRILTITLLLPLTYAQESAPHFEVASVKRVVIAPTSNGGILAPQVSGGPGTPSPTQIRQYGVWLGPTIAQAFGLENEDVTGPGWMNSERYEILATLPADTTKEQLKTMMQNLLVDRFHLKYRLGTKQKSVYALRIGKNGAKLEPGSGVEPADGLRRAGDPDAEGYPNFPKGAKGSLGRFANGRLYVSGRNVPITDIANWLRQPLGTAVVDETGLTGTYDFRMSFENRRGGPPPADAEPGPTAFDAVEKLGLKLEKVERSFPTILVESIDREPTAN